MNCLFLTVYGSVTKESYKEMKDKCEKVSDDLHVEIEHLSTV